LHLLFFGSADTGIPEFWITALLKCEVTAELIKDKDLDVLKYLTDITVSGG
jgi:nucleosome assembly protein 1-like 1